LLTHNITEEVTKHIFFLNTEIKFHLYIPFQHFFFTKTKQYSFIQIDRVHQIQTSLNITKNVKGEYVNKLTAPKLIAYNDKMPTNNMIKYKSLKYSCFRICNVDV